MTCKEKLIQDHPDYESYEIGRVLDENCPFDYDYADPHPDCGKGLCNLCWECWEQEVKDEVKEKENKTMTNTKKTKTQLIEELEAAKTNAAELKKQLDNMERYKQYEDCADEIKAMHTAFMNSGFTNEQAFDLIKHTISLVAPSVFKTSR